MESFDSLSDARQRLTADFASRFVGSVAHRVMNDDQSPIVVRVSRGGLGICESVRRTADLLDLAPIFVDVADGGDTPARQAVFEFVTRALPREHPPLREACENYQDRALIVLTGWESDRTRARDSLLGLMDSRRPADIVVIVSISDEDSDPDAEVGALLGRDMWQEISYIEVETSKTLDDDAIMRLGNIAMRTRKD